MAELSPELQGCSVVEHFLFRSARGELSHRDLSGNFAELKHRWDGGKRLLIAPDSLRGTKVLGPTSRAR